ncbi:MAG: 50S ribosomal protein L15 [Planctomycetaceae bacterium]|nr:50S ribosomal protein L15 [Planctomycetaceae bacterium]
MILDDVHRGIVSNRPRKRIGRGPGSGHGKTSGRGHNGYFSRSGSRRRKGYEGGQMPLARRVAKRGFSNRAFETVVAEINVAKLEHAFESGDTVNIETLRAKGLLKGRYDVVKILGDGELTCKLTVTAHRFSKSAEEKIRSSGGTVETIPA